MTGKDILQIHLLGDLRLIDRGRVLTLPPSKKTRALLAYLIATGRSHLRARLCDLLWEGPDDPRAALRWSLAKLRPLVDVCDTVRLVTDRERVAFASRGADVDVIGLAALASGAVSAATTGELKHAAARFSGEFAEGLDLPGCFRFQEWCVAEREKWAALRLAILTSLVERLRDTPEEALMYARSRVGIDPLDETGHVAVIGLLAALGRRRDALHQYDYCRQVLQAELGIKPGAALERAISPLRQPDRAPAVDRPAVDRRPATAARSSRIAEAEIVGRKKECAIVDDFVAAAAAASAQPRLLLLTGDAGIGKTRLLRYLAQSIAAAGGDFLTARAFEAEMRRPYGIWADLLKGMRHGDMSASIQAELRPLLFDATAASAKDGDRVQLFDAVVSLLAELSSKGPVAVLIDDLQWIDQSSISLLHYVIRAFDRPGSVVLAATARPGELFDNEPATRLVSNLARERKLDELALGPLDESATLKLARSMTSGDDVAQVVAASEGNPLFTLELARALADGANAVPQDIETVLAEHLSRPEGPARALLPWAAALGREFDIGVLTRCVKLSPSEWDDALQELERRGIIRGIAETRYDFSHDLIRSAAYGRISPPRRRLIHGQIAHAIAAALDANEGGLALAGELARHAELGSISSLAAKGYAVAGELSMRVFANDEAIDLAQRGLRHLQRVASGSERLRLHIALLKVQILASSSSRTQRWPNLLGDLFNAVTAAETAGLKEDAATGYYLLSVLHQDEGDIDEAQASTLRAAEAVRDADALIAATQLVNTARCLVELESDVDRSRRMLAEAGIVLRWHRSEVIETFWCEALLKRWDGALDAAVILMEEALELARDQEDRWRQSKCLACLAAIHFERGEPEASLACCRELLPLADRMGESGELPFAQALHALAQLTLRRPGAPHALESAVERLRAFDSKAHLAYILNSAAEIALHEGQFATAYRAAHDALVAAEATRRVWEAAISRALLARILVAQGDLAGAGRWFARAPPRFEQPDGLSARARRAEELAATALGQRAPTLDQTPP